MRHATTGWLIVSVCLLLLGLGTAVGAGMNRGSTVPVETIRRWRQYAAEVERGARTPSPTLTRMLTETAIAQHEYATAAQRLLRFLGAAVAIVSLLLVVDLVRYRARTGASVGS